MVAREGIFKERSKKAVRFPPTPAPPRRLLNARGGERPKREGGTRVGRPLLDPPLQLSPEQSGQEEFKLQVLPGEITSALHKNPTSAPGPRLHLVLMGLVLFSNS